MEMLLLTQMFSFKTPLMFKMSLLIMRLSVESDASFNKNVYVKDSLIVTNDATVTGKTITQDVSANGELHVSGKTFMNENVYINRFFKS